MAPGIPSPWECMELLIAMSVPFTCFAVLITLALGFYARMLVLEMTPQRGDPSSSAHIFRVRNKTAAAHAPEERAYAHAHEVDRNAVVLSANVSAARAAISTGPIRRALRWLHIQKCGQSFASTVFLFGCPLDVARQALRFLVTTIDSEISFGIVFM